MFRKIILFGASGDLTARLWMPAIAQLAAGGLLPDRLQILGAAREAWTGAAFRDRMAAALAEHAGHLSEKIRKQVVEMLDYRPADVTVPADVQAVIGETHEPTLVYLALPTFLLDQAFHSLGIAGLDAQDAVAIEKPFGTDLASARHLNETLKSTLPHPSIFRIDHFLSDELVRRILTLRFSNRIFEPLLRAQHVERVDISWLEKLALEGRAAYYDRAGALKDMIQNHLLEALSLLLLEQPARLDEPSFRGNRVEALRAVVTPTSEAILDGTVRARYSAGAIGPRQVPAYVDEPGVEASRGTETYAAVDLEVQNARWYGTRFTLHSGKAFADDFAEITIHFKPVPGYHDGALGDATPNVLRIGLMEPYVRLGITIKGPDEQLVNDTLEMVSPKPARSAYANLLLEMLNNRRMLFIRDDEVEETWRVIDPIAKAWAADEVPLYSYAAGTMPAAVFTGAFAVL